MNALAIRDALADALDGVGATEVQADAILALVDAVLTPPAESGLTPVEARIVAALRAAHGRHLNEAALIAAIGSTAESNVISVRLTHIRRKRPDLAACIQTRRCFGWRWVD